MQALLITGGGGFIGRNFASMFSDIGYIVHVAVKKETNLWRYEDNLKQNINFVNISLENKESWKAYLQKHNICSVIHLATYGSYPNQQNSELTLQTNFVDSLAFISACIDSGTVTKFLSAGSASEYSKNNGHSHENSSINSPNIYGLTKAAFGLLGLKLCEYSNIKFVHFRLFSIYGPYEDPNRIIPRIICYARSNKLPKLSDPTIARDFIYVQDAFNLFKIALEKNISGIYNLSSGINTNLKQLVETAINIFRISDLPIWHQYESRPFDAEIWTGANFAAKNDFDWKIETNLTEGIQKFASWISNTTLDKYYRIIP